MTEWKLFGVTPNFVSTETFEGEYIALVPSDDTRLIKLCSENSKINKFLTSFRDQFGVPVSPNALLFWEDLPQSALTTDAFTAFRDAVAVCIISPSRALMAQHQRGNLPCWSDIFEFYPWRLGKDQKAFISLTSAQTAIHDVEEFFGQTSPSLPHPNHQNIVWYDELLLKELMLKWCDVFIKGAKTKQDLKLFRSLNIAFKASGTPAQADVMQYDIGRVIASWVTAFETLAHSWQTYGTGKLQVAELLNSAEWLKPDMKTREDFSVGKKTVNAVKAYDIYLRLDRARNFFLHGEDFSMDTLFSANEKIPLHEIAPVLYRMALTSKLPTLNIVEESQSLDHHMMFTNINYQRRHLKFEEALFQAI